VDVVLKKDFVVVILTKHAPGLLARARERVSIKKMSIAVEKA
jgi:hypothetical protein